MKKFAVLTALTMIPLFASFLLAQERTEETTTKTTYNGTLIDAACQTTHTEHKETSTETNPDASTTTKTRTTHTTTVDCPATTTTTTFGLLTTDGRFIRFDDPSNTKVVEIVKENKKWNKFLTDRTPLKVSVVGTSHGDTVVLESIR